METVVAIKDKKYVERLFPVVNTENAPLGTVLLRFYDDMPNVAYISVSHFQEMIYPGLHDSGDEPWRRQVYFDQSVRHG